MEKMNQSILVKVTKIVNYILTQKILTKKPSQYRQMKILPICVWKSQNVIFMV